MRLMGYPRPSCEEDCGKPHISPANSLVLMAVWKYRRMLIATNGMGGWHLVTDGLRFALDRLGVTDIEDEDEFIERVQIYIDELMKQDPDTEGNTENE